MPTDSASATVVMAAPLATVLAAVRDVASQVQWVREITAAQVLETYDDGTPATAQFEMATMVGEDRYTLRFQHTSTSMTWSLVEGGMQQAQDGSYVLRDLGDGRTEVTLSLEVEHSISAPGFLRRQIFKGVVDGNLAGLKRYVEEGPG